MNHVPAQPWCFGAQHGSLQVKDDNVLPLLVGVHTASVGNASHAKHLVTGIWRTICVACALRCAIPSYNSNSRSGISIPQHTQVAIVDYGKSEVPDLEGLSRTSHHQRPMSVSRFVHFVADFGETLDPDDEQVRRFRPRSPPPSPPPLLAPAPAPPPRYPITSEDVPQERAHALAKLPGLAATRLIVRATNRSALSFPYLQTACQQRTHWRSVFRFIGVHNGASNELFRALAHDWPAVFRCEGEDDEISMRH